jgi:hypothetical protein
VATKTKTPERPLTDADWSALDSLLEGRSPYDRHGLLGVMHAVAVAPGTVGTTAWTSLVLPNGAGDGDAQRITELLGRLHRTVVRAVTDGKPMAPDPEDAAACDTFARGYVDAAELDPTWLGNDDAWSFTAVAAYLGGRNDLVPRAMLGQFEELGDDLRPNLRRSISQIIVAMHESSTAHRRFVTTGAVTRGPSVGRNDPCPCGSGKKYKRCCIDVKPAEG